MKTHMAIAGAMLFLSLPARADYADDYAVRMKAEIDGQTELLAERAADVIRHGGTVIVGAHLCVRDASRIWGTVPANAILQNDLFDDQCKGKSMERVQ